MYPPLFLPHCRHILTLREQTAQVTVRRQNNDDYSMPFNPSTYPRHLECWVTAYISICRIIVKFIDKFPEPELQGVY